MSVVVRCAIAAGAEELARREFEVVLITEGDANGRHFPGAALRGAVRLFEGATVFCNHADALDMTRPGLRRVEDIAGIVSGPRWDGGVNGIRATLATTGPKGELVAGLAAQIVRDRAAGLAVPTVGLSADVLCDLMPDGKTVRGIARVFSVDVVFNPARGGTFERVLNAVQECWSTDQNRGTVMGDELRDDGSRSNGDGAGAGVVGGGDAVGAAVSGAEGHAAQAGRGQPRGVAPTTGGSPYDDAGGAAGAAGGGVVDQVRATLADIQAARESAERVAQEQLRIACGNLLSTALQACTLPEPLKGEVREQFANRVFAVEDLNGAIQRKEAVYAKLVEGQVIRGMGLQGPMVRGMKNSLDRIQAAANMLLGAPVAADMKDTPRLSGIRELYVMLTGDYDFHGVFFPDRVQLANVTTTTVTSIVKNALNLIMLETFNMNPKWWAPIVHEEDFATMDQVTWMTAGGFVDLPTVAEGAAYTELEWSDAEETSSFAKKGGYVGITLEAIDRDKVGAIRSIPRRLGLSAYRTLSGLIASVFTSGAGVGPTLADGKALFHADHANLGTTALDITAWDGVVQAMYKQTEATSGKRTGVRPWYCMVPIELEKTALTLFGSPQLPGTANNDINVRAMTPDHVIVVPEWTDANNWAATADPAQCAGVCVGYRFGRVPELFVADDPLTGSMFTEDEMRIKTRFVVTVGVGDYRGLYKQNVA